MKYSQAQLDRAHRKLVRAMADWNTCGGDRSKKDRDLFMAAWYLIEKTGHKKYYFQESKKKNKTEGL